MIEYGGILSFLNKVKNSESVSHTSIIFSGFKLSPILNIARVFIYLLNSVLLILPVFIFLIFKKEFKIKKQLLIVLLFAFIPSFLFQTLIHNGNYVHLASILAPVFIFLISGFKITSKSRITFLSIIICLTLFQFFGLRVFDTSPPKIINANYFEKNVLGKVTVKKRIRYLNESYEKINNKYYLKESIYNNKHGVDYRRIRDIFFALGYKKYRRILNVLWLQYTYSGAKGGVTYRLKTKKIE
jgi:hypothetical protein